MILVTGASGLVGSYVCKKLLAEGKEFRAMVRKSSSLSRLDSIPEEYLVFADLLDAVSLEQACEGVDTIVHSGAIISFASSEYNLMDRINVDGTRYLVDLALKLGVRRFIHISSVSAVPLSKGDSTVSETAKWPGAIKASRYGESKYHSELEVWRGGVEGLEVIILNPATIMGPGDIDRGSPRLFKYVWDEKPFYTTGLLNYIDVRDFVEVIHHFLFSEERNEQYIVAGGTIPYYDFFKMIAKRFNKKAPHIKTTPLLTRVAIFTEWIKSVFSGKDPLVTKETAQRGNSMVVYSNEKISKKLELRFRTIEESVDWTCEELQKTFNH